MKAGGASIGIFQNLRGGGVSEVRLKKLDSFTLEPPKNHLTRNLLRNGRLRVNNCSQFGNVQFFLNAEKLDVHRIAQRLDNVFRL